LPVFTYDVFFWFPFKGEGVHVHSRELFLSSSSLLSFVSFFLLELRTLSAVVFGSSDYFPCVFVAKPVPAYFFPISGDLRHLLLCNYRRSVPGPLDGLFQMVPQRGLLPFDFPFFTPLKRFSRSLHRPFCFAFSLRVRCTSRGVCM